MSPILCFSYVPFSDCINITPVLARASDILPAVILFGTKLVCDLLPVFFRMSISTQRGLFCFPFVGFPCERTKSPMPKSLYMTERRLVQLVVYSFDLDHWGVFGLLGVLGGSVAQRRWPIVRPLDPFPSLIARSILTFANRRSVLQS